MAPPAPSSESGEPSARPKKAPRACQRCRTQKIRCDGFVQSTGTCSNCVAAAAICSYVDKPGATPRESWVPRWYVESLEDRVRRLESLLQKLHPGDTFEELGPPIEIGYWSNSVVTTESLTDPLVSLSKHLEDLHIDKMKQGAENDPKYYGPSSNASFMKKAMFSRIGPDSSKLLLQNIRRQPGKANWEIPEWQRVLFLPEKPWRLTFPPDDLLQELIEHYFEHENMFMPLLHRPTFMAMVQSRLYERDQNFGGIVLVVCACGARRSDDRRAWAADSPNSAGWHYYRQVHQIPRPLAEPKSLLRLQLYALMVLFLWGEGLVSLEWSLMGVGLRYAMDIGAHQKKSFSSTSPAERELWKRAFWTLFVLDQLTSNSLGRSCVIPFEDIDQDLPIEVDDDYWYHPDSSEAFKQPWNIPCTISCFNAFIRLMHLMPKMAVAMRYNSPATMQISLDHLADVDSSLNQWLEALPSHLMLGNLPSQDPKFLSQSTLLHAIYYMTVILAHRAFIPSPDAKSDSHALALCTNAARSCVRILHTFLERRHNQSTPWMWMTAACAGLILVLNVWLTDRRFRPTTKAAAIKDLRHCTEIIGVSSTRQHVGAQLNDVLWELMRVENVARAPASPSTLKRARPIDDESTTDEPVKHPRPDVPTSTGERSSLAHLGLASGDGSAPLSLASTSTFNGLDISTDEASVPTNGWFTPSDTDVGDGGQTFLDSLFPTGIMSDALPFASPDDEQSLMNIWSGTLTETEWSIWDHFLANPMDLPAPFPDGP